MDSHLTYPKSTRGNVGFAVEILRAACVPAYGDKPALIDFKTVTAMASTQLAKEYYVAKTVVNDAIRWRIISSAEHGIGWYPLLNHHSITHHD